MGAGTEGLGRDMAVGAVGPPCVTRSAASAPGREEEAKAQVGWPPPKVMRNVLSGGTGSDKTPGFLTYNP